MSTEAEKRAAEIFDEYVDDVLKGKDQPFNVYLHRCPQKEQGNLEEALRTIDFMRQYGRCPQISQGTLDKLYQDVQDIYRKQKVIERASSKVRELERAEALRIPDPASYLRDLLEFPSAWRPTGFGTQPSTGGFAFMNRGEDLGVAQRKVWGDEMQIRGMEKMLAPQAEETLQNAMLLDYPVDVYAVAEDLGIFLQEARLPEGNDGCIGMDGSVAGILLNKLVKDPKRKRFTLAHEIGHYVLHKHLRYLLESVDAVGSFSYALNEQQANTFAGYLLMPPSLMPKDIGRGRPSFDRADELSERFEVSLSAALRRIVRESHSRCALVVSQEGVVKWSAKGQDFDAFIKQRVHPKSIAALLLETDGANEDKSRYPADAWVDGTLVEEGVELWEESRRMENGFVYTLLTVDDPEY